MADQDDFDEYAILEEPDRGPNPRSRTWFWVVLVGAIVLLAFAAGMAMVTLLNRSGREGEATAVAANPTISPAVVGTPTPLGAGGTPTLTVTTTATPLLTPTPTPTPTLTPEPACTTAVQESFAGLYSRTELGCAVSDAGLVWSAWEPFERGGMLWRSDTDFSYAFFGDGQWTPINERWDDKPIPSRGDPPAGLQAPVRGFGYVWSVSDELFNRLGWARDQEKGFCALVQSFERGFILQSNTVEFCQDTLYNHARDPDWPGLILVALNNGQWRNTQASSPAPANPAPANPVPTNPAPVAQPANGTGGSAISRPSEQGVFYAPRPAEIVIDGVLTDWPERWTPIAAVVQGPENYGGATDLSGDFQVAWTQEWLALAVRVTDDVYSSGPAGTDMWQGDGFEIHLDRLLAADYDLTTADADDYQLGISFGPGMNEMRVYRWLPLDKEGGFSIVGTVASARAGYQAEFFIPWSLFDVNSSDLNVGQSFGFNVSINDNDSTSFAQQTVLSVSPRRTTFDNPTQWGTLVLGE